MRNLQVKEGSLQQYYKSVAEVQILLCEQEQLPIEPKPIEFVHLEADFSQRFPSVNWYFKALLIIGYVESTELLTDWVVPLFFDRPTYYEGEMSG